MKIGEFYKHHDGIVYRVVGCSDEGTENECWKSIGYDRGLKRWYHIHIWNDHIDPTSDNYKCDKISEEEGKRVHILYKLKGELK